MMREHYRKELLITELFEAGRRAMFPLNPIDFKVSKFQTAKDDKYGKVMFEINLYSSSPKLAQEVVYLKITSDTITIMDSKYNPVVTHRKLLKKGGESMDWLPYISLMANRLTALKYTSFYQELAGNSQNYLSDLPPDNKREAFLTLNTILQKHDIAAVVDEIEIALQVGVKDCDSILASYYRLTSKV
jgi:hypothetical protein